MKNVRKKAWFAANLVLPLWEAGRMVHAARYAAEKNAERFRRVWPDKVKPSADELSFDEAVAASGCSREVLMQRYLLSKRILLVMFLVTSVLAVLLPLVTLIAAGPGAGMLLIKALSLTFTLLAFASMVFSYAMKHQLRLWQLTTRELGSFAQWRATGTWLKDIFSWRSPS